MNKLQETEKKYKLGSLVYCAKTNKKFKIKEIMTSNTDMESIIGDFTGKARYLYYASTDRWAIPVQ